MFTILLVLLHVVVGDVSSRNDRVCFYNKDEELILVWEDDHHFIRVDRNVLMGTEYHFIEEGNYKRMTPNEVHLIITTVASVSTNFDSSWDKGEEQYVGEKPMIRLGNVTRRGLEFEVESVLLRKKSCNAQVFEIVKEIRKIYPREPK